MPGLKPPVPFRRGRRGQRGIPGQSSDQDLDATIKITVKEGSQSYIIPKELIQIGDLSAGRYVEIDATGLKLYMESGAVITLDMHDGSDRIGRLYTLVDSNKSTAYFLGQGKDASNHEASVQMEAKTDDGAAHAGSAHVYLTADTQYDRITLYATYINVYGALRLNSFTTTERNNLTAANGMLIYNTTTGKIQAYAGSSWVDLH